MLEAVVIVTLQSILAERLFNDMAPAGEKRYPGWLVDFGTAYGDGRGWWMGDGMYLQTGTALAPPLAVPLAVELDCGSDFTWNTDIMPSSATDAHPALGLDGATMHLYGVLVSVAASGATMVGLGDTILAVMAHGDATPLGTPVLLRVRRLFLYPTGEQAR